MKLSTAGGLCFLSIALWCMKNPRESSRRSQRQWKFWKPSAILTFLIGSLTLVHLFGFRFGVDELMVEDVRNLESSLFPVRMAPAAAICLTLSAIAFIFQDFSGERRARNLSQVFFIFVFFVSLSTLIGYIYGESGLYKFGPYLRMAWQTATCFLLLAIGFTFSRINRGVLGILTSEGVGGVMARWSLPTVIILRVFLGWLRVEGQQRGYFQFEMGTSLLFFFSSLC